MKPPSVITDETRRKIASEPPGMPYQQIADRYGVTWYHVKNIRMKAGVHKEQKTKSMEVVRPTVTIEGGTKFDRAIEAVEEQLAMFQAALNVLQGLRDLELAG